MSDEALRRAIAFMGTAFVVVVGATLLLLVLRSGPREGAPPASPSGVATGSGLAAPSPTPSPSPSPSPSPTLTASPTPSPTPTASPTPTPVPTPTPTPVPGATLTFVNLVLDATDDPAGEDRIITFTSDGPGTVTAVLANEGPQTTVMCMKRGTKDLGCKDWASGTFTAKTTQAHTNWRVTLRGSGIESPTVDLTVNFQALAAKVKIMNARFNGTEDPDQNGIQVRFVPRTDGDAHLLATWGGHPFVYEIDTFDETTGTGGATYPNQGPATNVDQPTPVTANDTWRLVLQNTETGFGIDRPDRHDQLAVGSPATGPADDVAGRPGNPNDTMTIAIPTRASRPNPRVTPSPVTVVPRTAPARLAPRTPPR